MNPQASGLSRRAMLKSMAVAGLGAALPRVAFGQTTPPASSVTAVVQYLESLARPDGGHAWADQPESHLTPTYAVIGCYRVLQQIPPRKSALAEFVRSHHPSRLKKLEQEHREFEFQQIQSLVWLGEDAASFREQISGWRKPTVYLKQYEQQQGQPGRSGGPGPRLASAPVGRQECQAGVDRPRPGAGRPAKDSDAVFCRQ